MSMPKAVFNQTIILIIDNSGDDIAQAFANATIIVFQTEFQHHHEAIIISGSESMVYGTPEASNTS